MFNIVLYQPEIPQNTGNISRTCAVTGTRLHLIKPYGFELSERTVRRAAGQSSTEVLSFYEDGQVKTRRTESNGAETTHTTEYIYFYQ